MFKNKRVVAGTKIIILTNDDLARKDGRIHVWYRTNPTIKNTRLIANC